MAIPPDPTPAERETVMGMSVRNAVVAVLALLVAGGCVRRPDGVLTDAEMTPVAADMQLAEAYIQTQAQRGSHAQREAMVDYVLRKHGLTREEFDTTMSWYGRNVDAYYDLCESVGKELERRRRRMGGNAAVESSDLWPYSRQSLISLYSPSNAFGFSIPTADIQSGQRVELRFRMRDRVSGSAMLGVEYDNGVKAFQTRTLSGVRRLKLVLQTDTGMKVSRIFGNMLLDDASQLPLWIDSISLSALPFDSLEYFNIHGQRLYRDPTQRRQNREELPDSAKLISEGR